ncbi:MAG: hypothetical protein U0802_01420 [Candidatus Binatia bacterium]
MLIVHGAVRRTALRPTYGRDRLHVEDVVAGARHLDDARVEGADGRVERVRNLGVEVAELARS